MSQFAVGQWFVNHWRAIARRDGVFTVAKRMRKQGVPCEVALAMLARGVR